jgi:hypothetical protein
MMNRLLVIRVILSNRPLVNIFSCNVGGSVSIHYVSLEWSVGKLAHPSWHRLGPVAPKISMAQQKNPSLRKSKLTLLPSPKFFYIYLSQFCKNIWSVTNFAKKYICRRGPQRQGHNVVAHGGRSR